MKRYTSSADPCDYRWALIQARTDANGDLPAEVHHTHGRLGADYADPSHLIGLGQTAHRAQRIVHPPVESAACPVTPLPTPTPSS